jgi:hypothetical protein
MNQPLIISKSLRVYRHSTSFTVDKTTTIHIILELLEFSTTKTPDDNARNEQIVITQISHTEPIVKKSATDKSQVNK